MKKISLLLIRCSTLLLFVLSANALGGQNETGYILKPDRVFDGREMHNGWIVVVNRGAIVFAGPQSGNVTSAYPEFELIELNGQTLLPGLIEGHSHLLLHPYNETSWNDQVLVESEAERVARATVHAWKTLAAGFTTVRDLGSEGAGYADVGIKSAIEKGIIPGPRMLVAGRAIVSSGSYGPKGFAPHVILPKGAQEADGLDHLTRVVREQIGYGADLIKVYADYRWGPNREARPTFTLEELKLIVAVAKSSGRPVVAHASSAEGMERAARAGVVTIEHGDGGTPEVFELMAGLGVALCPTLAAGDAILQYQGWQKDREPDPERIVKKRRSFQQALAAGVTICAGGDVGVFEHGTNARELIMMVEYGMEPMEVLRSATSGNAKIFQLDQQLGWVKKGMVADLISVSGDPQVDIRALKSVKMVMKAGVIFQGK